MWRPVWPKVWPRSLAVGPAFFFGFATNSVPSLLTDKALVANLHPLVHQLDATDPRREGKVGDPELLIDDLLKIAGSLHQSHLGQSCVGQEGLSFARRAPAGVVRLGELAPDPHDLAGAWKL